MFITQIGLHVHNSYTLVVQILCRNFLQGCQLSHVVTGGDCFSSIYKHEQTAAFMDRHVSRAFGRRPVCFKVVFNSVIVFFMGQFCKVATVGFNANYLPNC